MPFRGAGGRWQGTQSEIVSPGQCAIDSTIISNFSDIFTPRAKKLPE